MDSTTSSEYLNLLGPAGSLEMGMAVLDAGADAVFAGLKGFSRRGFEYELACEEIQQLCDFARYRGKQVRLAINSYPHDCCSEALWEAIDMSVAYGVNTLIVNDPGLCRELRVKYPAVDICASVGASILNLQDARFWEDCGATGLVLLCNLSPEQVRPIADGTNCGLEILVHANRDFTFLGKCWISSYCAVSSALSHNQVKAHGSPNRGGVCYRVCRGKWRMNGIGIFDTRESDLPNECILLGETLANFAKAGVMWFKVQGREYSLELTVQMVSIYRRLLDKITDGSSSSGCKLFEELNEIEKKRDIERCSKSASLLNTGVGGR